MNRIFLKNLANFKETRLRLLKRVLPWPPKIFLFFAFISMIQTEVTGIFVISAIARFYLGAKTLQNSLRHSFFLMLSRLSSLEFAKTKINSNEDCLKFDIYDVRSSRQVWSRLKIAQDVLVTFQSEIILYGNYKLSFFSIEHLALLEHWKLIKRRSLRNQFHLWSASCIEPTLDQISSAGFRFSDEPRVFDQKRRVFDRTEKFSRRLKPTQGQRACSTKPFRCWTVCLPFQFTFRRYLLVDRDVC